MEGDLPKFHETYRPILEVLASGDIIMRRELTRRVRDEYYSNLSIELQELTTKAGEPLLLNRIGFGISYLKMGKFIEHPERGKVQITEKGKKLLQKTEITSSDISEDPDFITHKKRSAIKTSVKKGEAPEASPQDLIDAGIQEIESEVITELLDRLRNSDPYYFEVVVLNLFKAMGYGNFEVTKKSGDGGIDGIINQDSLGLEKIYVQSKRYADNNLIQETHIRNFIGAMSSDTLKGLFVTTSTFSQAALDKALSAQHSIVLIDGDHLAMLMYTYGVGVQVKDTYIVKEIDEDFFIGN